MLKWASTGQGTNPQWGEQKGGRITWTGPAYAKLIAEIRAIRPCQTINVSSR